MISKQLANQINKLLICYIIMSTLYITLNLAYAKNHLLQFTCCQSVLVRHH